METRPGSEPCLKCGVYRKSNGLYEFGRGLLSERYCLLFLDQLLSATSNIAGSSRRSISSAMLMVIADQQAAQAERHRGGDDVRHQADHADVESFDRNNQYRGDRQQRAERGVKHVDYVAL